MTETELKRDLAAAVEHLRRADPILAGAIDAVGPCGLTPRRDRFDMLVRSILSQQISTAAARTIRARLIARVGVPRPDTLLALSDDDFRGCGVSPQKMSYLRDLAEKVASGAIPLGRLGRLSDEEVIDRLVAVRGVGRWTAQMFLIFSLGRPDVLPHDDLGVRNAMRALYALPAPPSRAEMDAIAAPWRPYASVACWYCWRYLEIPATTVIVSEGPALAAAPGAPLPARKRKR